MTANASAPRPIIKRLLQHYVKPHKRKILLATLCMVIAAGATAANAWVMQPVLDEIFVNRNVSMLGLVPLIVISIAVIGGLANYGHTILMRFVGQRAVADMQIDLFDHLMHADLGMFHDQASGRLISRFTNDIQMMRHSVSNVLTGVAKETLTMVFLIGIMFYQSWELSLLALVGFPLAIFPIARLGRRMRKISDGTQRELGEFTAQLDESFQGVRMVKAYGREDFEKARAERTIERLFKLYYKAARVQAAASPMMETLGGVAIALVIWYGGYHVIQGETTPGAFFSFITAMLMAYKPVKTMASLNTYLQEGLAAAQRFFNLLDVLPQISNKPGAKPLRLDKAAIQVEQASFYYPDGTKALDNITLSVPAHQTVALVGASGSGKSTLINLIMRFYDVQEGEITIDGQDITAVTLASLRSTIALVSQEVVLFDDTVRANIAYGRLEASEDEIIEIAKRADAHQFIQKLPHGYDTLIGPHGVKLSGGQRQRLSIARAMLKNAPILLLDEATSALDSQSERSVQLALDALMRERTTLVIAHRLSTVQHADLIYVLDHGCIVESGNHDTLMAKNGYYAALYHAQFARPTALITEEAGPITAGMQ